MGGYDRIIDLGADAESEPIVRYGRSFDRQWAFGPAHSQDRESPLWAVQGGAQVFLVTKPTLQLGKGPRRSRLPTCPTCISSAAGVGRM